MDLTFRGRYDLKIDTKGRLTVPSSLRELITRNEGGARSKREGTSLVVTNGLVNGRACLDVYTKPAWGSLEKRIMRLPPLDRNVQAFQRFYLAAGMQVELDGQGRILIPPAHRAHARFAEDIVAVGMGSKLELWDLKAWNEISKELSEQFEDVLANVAKLEGKSDD